MILGIAMKEVRDEGFSLKRRGQDLPPASPFQTLFIAKEGDRQ